MKVQNRHEIYEPRMECMSRDERAYLQGERLRQTVRHEYDNVKLYRDRMDAYGISPDDIHSIEDLHYLPFMEKTDLRDNFPYGMIAVPMDEIVRIQGSSGTTGKPIVVGYTREDVDMWTQLMARSLKAAGAGKNDIIQVAYGYGLFTGGLGAHQGADKLGATVLPMSSGNTLRQLIMLRELGTTMLCCTPSYAIFLGESMHEAGIGTGDIKLKSGCFGAEPWTEGIRQRLEELFDIDACDIYGLTEIAGPGVAFECLEKRGMHLNEDHVLAEIVDPATGTQLPMGESGELVLTTITKRGMPMIRYRTHDICTLDASPCGCGRTLVRMGRITGRTDDMLIIRGVNVFPTQIEAVLTNMPGIAPHYMLVADRVRSADVLEVRVEMTDDMFSDTMSHIENLRKEISERIKSVVGIQAGVKLVAPHSIERSEGKAKRVIDNRKL